jgi:hypothetical protein
MFSLRQILSQVQQSINDLEYSKVQRAEYIDCFHRVVENVSHEVHLWLSTKDYTPNPTSAPIDPAPNFFVLPAADKVQYFIRMTKNGVDCREYSLQAIGRSSSFQEPFPLNETQLPDNSYAIFVMPDETVRIYSAAVILPGDKFTIEYLTSKPYTAIKWDSINSDNIQLPDFMVAPIEAGMKMNLFLRLYERGDEAALNRYRLWESKYLLAKEEAAKYTRRLKDKNSFVQIRPYNWLGTRNNYEGQKL